MYPIISVVIPTFNTSQTALMRTLESVVTQTFYSTEIILVDDKSKVAFSGLDVKQLYPDSHIQLIVNPVNYGVAKTRNIGITRSKGEYIAFLDAGDWWEPQKLERQYNKLSVLNQYCAVYTGAVFHHKNKVIKEHSALEGELFKTLLIRQAISGSASSMMVRKRAIDDVGVFYEKSDIPEDRDLWLRLARKYPITYIDEYHTHIEITHNSRSMNLEKKKQTYKSLLKLYEKDLVLLNVKRSAYAHYNMVLAKKYLMTNHYFQFFSFFIRAILCSPLFVTRGAIKQIEKKIHEIQE